MFTRFSHRGTTLVLSPRMCVFMTMLARNADKVISAMLTQKYVPTTRTTCIIACYRGNTIHIYRGNTIYIHALNFISDAKSTWPKKLHCVSEKNAPTLARCSSDKHGLMLIVFGQQHQHTLETTCMFSFPYPFTFTYFICF